MKLAQGNHKTRLKCESLPLIGMPSIEDTDKHCSMLIDLFLGGFAISLEQKSKSCKTQKVLFSLPK